MKFNKDILPKWYSIVLWILILFFTQGCYTQLSMFYPEPEMETEDNFVDFYASYSRAPVRPNLTLAAQHGAGQSLGMAYQTMYNRFSGFMGYGRGYNYYNPYYNYNGGYYNNSYTLGGYTMYIPYTDLYKSGEKKIRTWTRDTKSPGTNLTVTRTRSTQSNTNSNTNNNSHTNSSNVSSNRSSSTSSSSSSSSSSGGRRATKRN
jgi:uncharacterized membrane protein YgcG